MFKLRKPKNRVSIGPRWRTGDTLKLLRYIPPLLCGTAVTIQKVDPNHGHPRYQVTSSEYKSPSKWVHEEELGIMFGDPT